MCHRTAEAGYILLSAKKLLAWSQCRTDRLVIYTSREAENGDLIYISIRSLSCDSRDGSYVTVGTVLSVTLLSQKNEGQESFFLCMHYAIKNTGTKIEESTVCIVVITVAGIIDITN